MTADIMEKYDLTLHQMRISRSLRATWLAAELGILEKIKLVDVALFKGEQNQPSFRKVNKMSAVPVLILTDKNTKEETVMTESAAICTFLTDHVPSGASLKPDAANIPALAAYHRYIVFAVSSFDQWLWQIRLHEELLPEDMALPGAIQFAKRQVKTKVIPALEDALNGREYICEPHHKGFTTADVVLGFACFWAARYGLLEDSPVLKNYVERVTGRAQFKAAIELRTAL